MALEKYRARRDFAVSPEPRGARVAARKKGLSFVIQKHAASHLHYDFRLELNGVLLSWAVPKGPSVDPADKRLAMHVEDHPLEYGGFEGVIPAGQYGAGTVMLWDSGTWHPRGDPEAAYAGGHLKFELEGDKLRGGWALVRTRDGKYGGKTGQQAWLLIKKEDEFARAGGSPVVDRAPDSVMSGRTLEEIAAARAHAGKSRRPVGENRRAGALAGTTTSTKPRKHVAAGSSTPAAIARIAGAKRAKLPATIAPMLATLAVAAPAGPDWLHEIKYDGYRMLGRLEGGKARLYSRNGKDWTTAFAAIAADLAKAPVRSAWIDGEVVVLDKHGRSNFQALQDSLNQRDAEHLYFAFDLVFCDGYDLRKVVLGERKRILRAIMGDGTGGVRVGPEIRGHGDEFFRQACSLSLEGAICKRVDSLYHDGARTRDWVKLKCTRRQELVIGGYTSPQGSRVGFGALLLGVYDGDALRYAGKVGTGFDEQTLDTLHALLLKRGRDQSPFANPPRGYRAKGVHWVRPDLVVEVAFTEWSRDGALRHPSFQGLRVDKKATDVRRELAHEAPAGRLKAPAARPAAGGASGSAIAGITLSNPDKLYFPEARLTKREIASYHERMAPWILPHLRGRPLSLVRCPDGWKRQCFYQKHADDSVDAAVDRIQVPEGEGTATYLGAANARALVALVQWGVFEMHPWGSRLPRLDRPDRLIFDLDPDDSVDWKELATAVSLVRTLLNELKLQSFLKTTGGKGLHVVVPIRRSLGWEQAKGFTRSVAEFLAHTFDDRFTASVSKARRKGKIFVDYLRNAEGATAIAPYCVRARAGAPVSMPIEWNELATDVRYDYFNVRNAQDRIAARKRDPWKDLSEVNQTVTTTYARRLGIDI